MYPVNWLQLPPEMWEILFNNLNEGDKSSLQQAFRIPSVDYTRPTTQIWQSFIHSPNKNSVLSDSCCQDCIYECDNGDVALFSDEQVFFLNKCSGKCYQRIVLSAGVPIGLKLVQPFRYGLTSAFSPRDGVYECQILDRANNAQKKHTFYFLGKQAITIKRIFMLSDGEKLIIGNSHGVRVDEINLNSNPKYIKLEKKEFTCLAPLYDDRIGIGFPDGSIEIHKIENIQNTKEHQFKAHRGKIIGIRVLRDGGLVAASQAGPGAPIEICRWGFGGNPFSQQQQRSNCVVM